MARLEEFDDVQLDVEFTQAGTRSNLTSKENIAISFGKIAKWYEALVPTGGSSGQFLGFNSSGTAKWVSNPNVDEKVKATKLAQSTADASYYPALVAGEGTAGVSIFDSAKINHTKGTTSAVGNTRLILGNATNEGATNNEEGLLRIYSPGTKYHTLKGAKITTDNVEHTLPTTGGTILNTGTTSFTQTLSSGTKIGTIKINGTSSDIYAPNDTDTKVTDTVGTANTYYPAGGTSTSTATGTQVFDTSFKFIGTTGTTSAVGKAQLVLGNATASGTVNNKQGSIVVYGSTAYAHTIQGAPTAARTLTLPDKTGTFALTSDIPSVPTVNDAALTLKGAGTTVTTFTANASSAKSLDIVAGSNVTVTADATNAKISIASSHPTITKSTDTTSTASPAHGGTFTVVDSITREANGHVTKINTKTVTLPADSNTDTKVTQSATTTTNYRPILFGAKNSTDVSTLADTITDQAYTSTKMFAKPDTGILYASGFSTSGYTNGTGAQLAQYGLYLKSYKSASLPAGGDYSYSRYALRVYDGKSTDSAGMLLEICGGGLTIVGAGESASSLAALISDDQRDSNTSRTRLNVGGTLNTAFSASVEQLILSSDNNIYFITKCNTIADRKPVVLDTNSYFYPGTTKTGSIGTSSYMWNSVYAATIYENGTSLASKYAAIGHTHTTTIAADSGTNQLTLAASTKYKLTAGETNFIFTTPPNTTYSAGTGLSLSGTTINHSNSVTARTNYDARYIKYDAQGHVTGASYWTATATGTDGEAGWIKIATIVHTKTYDNTPIMLFVSQRGDIITYRIHIQWTNSSTTDPPLGKFHLVSDENTNAEAYIIKSATSTWDLYIKKIDSYEAVGMHLYVGKYFSDHMTWTWQNVQTAASAITGGTAATKMNYYNTKTSRTANTVLAAPNGSDGVATFRKLVAADIPSLNYSKVTSSTTNGKIKIDGTDTTVYAHPSYTSKTSGLYKITVDTLGHVSATASVAKGDIPALDYLPLAGGTMTGDIEYPGPGGRKTIFGKSAFMYYVASSANWAGGLNYYSNDGSTGLGAFGAYGQANALEYHYIGGTYNAPQIKIEPTGPNLIINSEDASTPMITLFRKGSNKADWRIVNTSGNLKFQSDYTTAVGDWYDALTVEYNTGNITMKTDATFTFGKFASATANANRHVFFKDNTVNRICVNDNFKYNPSTNILTVGSITGNATSATKATQDGDGNTISSTYLKLSGGSLSGSMNFKSTTYDGSAANNGVPSGISYPTTFNILDKSSRILVRLEGLIDSSGSIGSYWYVRNYNTSGTQVGQKGISMRMAKDGTLTYGVDDGAKFRSAIGAGTSSLVIGTTATTAAAGNHTHSYAGSSSAGGAATSANKLNTNDGTANRPVYFSGGVPVQCDAPLSGSWFKGVPQIGTDGVMEIGRYLDFHSSNTGETDYDVRIDVSDTSQMTLISNSGKPRFKIKGTEPILNFAQTTTGKAYDSSYTGIIAYPGDTSGLALVMQSGGMTVIASGESGSNGYPRLISTSTSDTDKKRNPYLASGFISTAWSGASEVLILSSDNAIYFQTNMPNSDTVPTDWDNLKTICIDSSGNFKPTVNKKGQLGTSSLMWNAIYGNTIYENGTSLTSKYAAKSHTHSYLPLAGGTMTGDIVYPHSDGRSLTMTNSGMTYKMAQSNNWAMGLTYVDSGETHAGFIGAYGTTDAFESIRFGAKYNDWWMKITNTETTIAGDLVFSTVTSTTYPAESKKIKFGGGTDWGRIYYRVDASDAGRLVLDIGDDSNARIDFAYNGTTKSYIDTSGNFSGNAATSSSWAIARTLTLSGQLTGSVSVKGDANMTLSGWLKKSLIYDETSDFASYAWHKFAEKTITGKNEDQTITFIVSKTWGNVPKCSGILTAHIRTGSTKVYESSQFYWQLANAEINPEDFVFVYTNTADTSCKVELWYKQTSRYDGWIFTALKEHSRTSNNNVWTLYTSAGHGSASHTTGTNSYASSITDIKNNTSGTSSNVTGTVAIANGGTGATTRLNALKNLTNEAVGTSATYFLTITDSWGKGGYSSVANVKTVLGLKSAAYTESSDYVPNTQAGVSDAINLLSTGSSTPSLTDYYVAQYVNGGTTTTSYHRRPISALWNAFKGLITLATTGTGNAVTAVSIANDGDNDRKITVTKGSTFSLSTHTHNYAGSSSAGGPATNVAIARVTKDSKVFPGSNKVVFEEYTNGTTYNLPSNHFYHIMSAQGSDAKYGTQLALGMTTTAAYYRSCNNQTWSAWKSIINSDTYDRNRYNANIKAGSSALVAANIIVGKDGVYNHLKSGGAFDITYPILYLAGAVDANGTTSNTYDIINFTITTTQSLTLTAYRPVYIKGTLNGTIFTPANTTPLTQTIPTSGTTYDYIYLGQATSSTAVYLQERHPIYSYRNGRVQEITPCASMAVTSDGFVAPMIKKLYDNSATSTNYITISDVNIDDYEFFIICVTDAPKTDWVSAATQWIPAREGNHHFMINNGAAPNQGGGYIHCTDGSVFISKTGTNKKDLQFTLCRPAEAISTIGSSVTTDNFPNTRIMRVYGVKAF